MFQPPDKMRMSQDQRALLIFHSVLRSFDMASLLLALDAENIEAYNSYGAAVADAISRSDLAPLHHPFVLGMFAVYSMLVSMDHFTEEDIYWPPHTLESFDPQMWLNAGFEAPVATILVLLPYPREEFNHWHVALEAEALSYMGSPRIRRSRNEEYVEQRCYDFVGDGLICSDHVRLTAGGQDGNNYIYDTKAGKISSISSNIRT
jgi:hypothetical protein